jgi:drug/metabolite transporter (DMT)-like permease
MHTKTMSYSTIQGAILATMSAFIMSVLMAIAKKLPGEIPTSLVLFIRCLFMLLFSLPLLIRNPRGLLKSDQYLLHGLQIVLGVCATLCTYYTYRHLPVTLATSLGMTGALFTTVLSVIILKDAVDRIKWSCIFAGYLGTLCILQPGAISFDIGIITALLANLLAGFGAITSKILSQKVDRLAIITYNTLGMTIIFGFLSYPHWHLLNQTILLVLACMGALALGCSYCYLTALKKASPSFLAPFEYTRLIFAFVIGFVLFDELPNLYTILGSVVIVAATYIITYRDSRQTNKPSTSQEQSV